VGEEPRKTTEEVDRVCKRKTWTQEKNTSKKQ